MNSLLVAISVCAAIANLPAAYGYSLRSLVKSGLQNEPGGIGWLTLFHDCEYFCNLYFRKAQQGDSTTLLSRVLADWAMQRLPHDEVEYVATRKFMKSICEEIVCTFYFWWTEDRIADYISDKL